MNSSSPLIPQGSNLEQQNKARSSLKVKIFCALGVNVAVLLVLLMQGCKREQPIPPAEDAAYTGVFTDTNPPPMEMDTNVASMQPDPYTVAQPEVTPIPQETYVPPAASTPSATEYKIQSGDTFSTIAPKFNVTVKALVAANPTVDPTKLQIGKTIQIPPPTATTAALSGTVPVVDAASGETVYTVKSGDTLGKLATQFRTTVAAIQAANGLADTRIKVGQKLKIPAKTSP
jgi:LysM repeat protein